MAQQSPRRLELTVTADQAGEKIDTLLRRERMLLRLALPGLLFPDVITLKRIHVPVAPSLSFSLRVLYAARWDDVQKEVNFSPPASHICAERPKPARNIGYSPIYFLRAEE